MATILDVAREAGVSTATVSRVFNGIPVSDDKAERVRAAAARLGFRLNRTARSLRRRHSDVIALVIPDIENPYFTEVARGAEDVARAAGYSLVLCNSDADLEKEAQYLGVAAAENMAGVLLAAARDDTDLAVLEGSPTRLVALDRPVAGVDEVLMDNREAGEIAARALRGRIVGVTGPEHVATARDRAEGMRAGGAEEVLFAGFDVAGGRAAARGILDAGRPDAIVAGNNLLGVGVLQEMAERGLGPSDIRVAVIGSLPFTTLDPQAVTIVRLPSRDMGRVAAEHLLRRVEGDDAPVERVVLHGELVPAGR